MNHVPDHEAGAGAVAQKPAAQKPLTKITINDIDEDCGINRMTFYYHFKDIYDLVEWACLEDARAALEEKKTYATWQGGFCRSLKPCAPTSPSS